MKTLILICLCFTFPAISLCQKTVTLAENIKYGIYLNFTEFQKNKPSIVAGFKPVYRGDYYGYPPTRLKIKTPEGKYVILDKPVWGYHDSTNFYIYRKGFNKLEKFGRYCVFEGLKRTLPEIGVIDKVINIIEAKVKYRDYILDISSGQIVKATTSSILEILADDRELYRDFKNNGKKIDVYTYIERYNQRHPIVYPDTLMK
jgi:hypothetical protein